jgi:hypothetical protein
MRVFYVRPSCAAGYGRGDGTSYDNAWNGFKAVDWAAMAGDPATLWVCGSGDARGGFMTVHIDWSYLKSLEHELRPAETRTDPRRESPQPV